MVLPIFLGMTAAHAGGPSCHAHAVGNTPRITTAVLATLAHGAGYLLVTAAAAWIVYEKLGVGLLRKAWVNLDLVWAAALIVTGGVSLVV